MLFREFLNTFDSGRAIHIIYYWQLLIRYGHLYFGIFTYGLCMEYKYVVIKSGFCFDIKDETLNSHLRYFKGFNNCYIILTLVMSSDKGINKGKEIDDIPAFAKCSTYS